jgi:hypothetical protein
MSMLDQEVTKMLGSSRGRIRRAAAAVCIAAAATAAVVGSGPAQAGAAGAGCAGSLVESRALNVAGKKVGELAVYYDAATGKNCAKMNHAGSTWGKRLKTRVWIGICAERKPGDGPCTYDPNTDAVDVGDYKYYAGPVTTKKSARGRCIAASGYLWIGGKRHAIGTSPWVGHCGG